MSFMRAPSVIPPFSRDRSLLPHLLLWAMVLACCGLPLGWMVWQIASNPQTWVEFRVDSFRLELLGRTLLYNVSAAVIATILSLPAAIVLGRGRGWTARVLWFVLPVSLLLPSLTYAYGWSQFVRLTDGFWGGILGSRFHENSGVLTWLGITLVKQRTGTFAYLTPGAKGDVARCVWTLATWLWALPAGVIGLALRQVDSQVQQQALLDGALWRVTWRQLLGPMLAATAMASVLAMQEFGVYEPTGISVIATEVRMVFDTGEFSSPDNPITAPITPGGDGASLDTGIGHHFPDQRARAAAALATAVPLLGAVAVLAFVAAWGVRKLSAEQSLEPGAWPSVLDAGWKSATLAILSTILCVVVPIASLWFSLHERFRPGEILTAYSPQLIGSIELAFGAGAVAALWILLGTLKRNRALLVLCSITFLIGGQLLAIAQLRLYNHPRWGPISNGAPIVIMTYLARFGWVGLLAARATWSRPWQSLREISGVDGADSLAVARYVVWPLVWPGILAAAVLTMILSLVEVPATVLLSPLRPPHIVPMLMTWVHMLRYDPMIEASLVLMGLVVVLSVIAMGLGSLGLKAMRIASRTAAARGAALIAISLMLLSGCGRSSGGTPEVIWPNSENHDKVAFVYPRGISYSPRDGSYFVVDRMARIQHLDASGQFLNDWRMPASQQGKPVGLTVGPDGNLYVPDTHYHRVMVYSPKGELLRQWGSMGMDPGQFIYPTDIAFDSAGNVFVAEYGDHDRIQVFTPDGTYRYEIGRFGQGNGEFSRPQSILIEGDMLYVADACNHRIVVFKTDGTFVKNLGRSGSEPGQFRFPYGLDQDKDGNLVVCEFGNSRVQLIDKNTGKGLRIWGAPGHEPGQLAYPWGVAVDKENRVVTVDAGNNRLQMFEF